MPRQYEPEIIGFVSKSLHDAFHHTSNQVDAVGPAYSSPQRTYDPSERLSLACELVDAILEARLDCGDRNVLAGVIETALQMGEAAATHRTNRQLFGR